MKVAVSCLLSGHSEAAQFLIVPVGSWSDNSLIFDSSAAPSRLVHTCTALLTAAVYEMKADKQEKK